MTDNWETQLKDAASKETYRRGRSLFGAGAVVSCVAQDNGCLDCVVLDKDEQLKKLSLPKAGKIRPRKSSEPPFSAFEVAALIHYHSFQPPPEPHHLPPADDGARKKPATAPKLVPIEKLVDEVTSENRATLLLNCDKAMPNTPSTWERQELSVKIEHDGKSYIGNSGKLRQLRFEEGASGLKMAFFSSRDKQIIRFLTQYAEPGGNGFSMKSELMAEFFHCLVDYDGFRCHDERVNVHGGLAELVVARSDKADSNLVFPALAIPGGTLPLNNPHLVVGRSGLWVGVGADYWWVPASVDVLWMKTFLLNGSREWPKDKPLPEPQAKPRVVTASCSEIKPRRPQARHLLRMGRKNILELELLMDYGEETPDHGAGIFQRGGQWYVKDRGGERTPRQGVEFAGFQRVPGGRDEYRLADPEAIGVFLEQVLPAWTAEGRALYLSPELAAHAAKGPEPVAFVCSNPVDIGDCYELDYKIATPSGSSFSWREAVKLIKDNRRFGFAADGALLRVPEELVAFLNAMTGVAQPGKQEGKTLVPKAATLYWTQVAENLPEATPVEWEKLKDYIHLNARLQDRTELEGLRFTGELRGYQKEAVHWIADMTACGFNVILADEMGLGKTAQALALLSARSQHAGANRLPSLILCPTSLVENWEAEAAKFVPDLKVLVINGANRQGCFDRVDEAELVISSYALAKRDVDAYAKHKFDFVILDEAQHIKNPGTVNARTCKSFTAAHRLVLTGTPLENSPDDMWSIFDFLNPGMMGSLNHFKKRYAGIMDDPAAQQDLASRSGPFILRRLKKDVDRQLPPKIEQTLFCDMEPEQRELYESLLRDGQSRCHQFLNGKGSRFDVLTSLLRLRQLCCHPLLLPPHLRHDSQSGSAKTDLVQELLLQAIDSSHRTLVFSQFTSLLAILRGWLESQDIPYEYLDGNTKNRLERVDRFNADPKLSVFLLSLKAGGTGLNLTGADTVIIYDPWWNPSVEAQATDRTHRIGQQRAVTSMKVVLKDTVEEKILALQRRKQGLFNNVVENSASFSGLSDRDLEYLLK